MTDHRTSYAASAVTDEAISWLMRLRDPACTRQERKQFEAWLAADAAHAREYQNLLEIWTVTGRLQPAVTRSAPTPRRRVVLTALSFGLVLLTVLAWFGDQLPNDYRRHVTGDYTKNITLPDGSTVLLGMNTELTFRCFRAHWEIRFDQGEAFFDVRQDGPARLEVLVGNSRIQASGTRFNLWYDEGRAVVTPVEDSIEVQGIASVSVGQQVRFSEASSIPRVTSANLEQTLAWREGKLILSNIALAEALPLINRYLHRPLRLGDEAAARVHIGGIYNTRDIEGLVRALPKIAPVRISNDSNGDRTVYSVPHPAR